MLVGLSPERKCTQLSFDTVVLLKDQVFGITCMDAERLVLSMQLLRPEAQQVSRRRFELLSEAQKSKNRKYQ